MSSASASASLPLTTCTVDRRGNYTCSEAGPVTVSAEWSGQGDLVRSNSNYHIVSKGFTYNSHFQGSFRSAVANGQANGADFSTSFFGSIFDLKSSDVYICHAGC